MEWDRIIFFCCSELEAEVGRGIDAGNRLERLVREQSRAASIMHAEINTMLEAAARLKAYLYPKPTKNVETKEADFLVQRAHLLFEALELEESSELSNNQLRNHEVHFDERLTRWMMNSKNRTFGRRMLGSLERARELGIQDEDIMSLFDVDSGDLYFWGDCINVFNLLHAMNGLKYSLRCYFAANSYETVGDC